MNTITTLLPTSDRTNLRDCELLLAHVLKKPREWTLTHPKAPVRPATAARYRRLLQRLTHGEPLPYLLGEHWFYGRSFTVNRSVLIPRSESELLVDLVLQHVRVHRTPTPAFAPPPREATEGRGGKTEGVGAPLIVDVGTGSGCLAVTVAAELAHARVIATDTSPAALRVARANARHHSAANQITFLRGDLLGSTFRVISRARPEKSHMMHGVRSLDFAPAGRSARDDTTTMVILANLPYLTTAEWRALPRSFRAYEPRVALDGGPDGLTHFRKLFAQLQTIMDEDSTPPLRPFPVIRDSLFVLLEIDPRRKRALAALIQRTLPEWRASWHRDLAGRYRVLSIQY